MNEHWKVVEYKIASLHTHRIVSHWNSRIFTLLLKKKEMVQSLPPQLNEMVGGESHG